MTTEEVLARENLSFDNKPRFFSTVSELEIFKTFILEHEPGKNNVLSTKVYFNGPHEYSIPLDLTYNVSYNDQGLIVDSIVHGLLLTEHHFSGVTYDCN